ncbi:SDR family oxidoreductase [Achromobacter mucicolens]|nr:2-(R)-hydroxypropyl-CoM dehydrogenase [Achromobacter mucicolens]
MTRCRHHPPPHTDNALRAEPCREVTPVMRNQGRGAIVNVGSNATRGIYRVPYSASKGGVRAIPRNTEAPSEQDRIWQREMYTDCLAGTPMHRMGSMEEVAAAICFLAAPEASYITGQVMYVAGGHVG